jgi:thiaminase/transcriptional activator TenA
VEHDVNHAEKVPLEPALGNACGGSVDMLNNLSPELLSFIYNHRFNQQLANGCLPAEVFDRFIVQDKVYLKCLAGLLHALARRLENTEHHSVLITLATMTVKAEEEMLSSLNRDCFFSQTSPNKALQDYLKHLLHCAAQDQDVEVAIASVLPCFYIYKKLGERMSTNKQANNPYQAWIDSYSDAHFVEYTNKLITVTTTLAIEKHQHAIDAFITSAQHELAFFDSVYPHPAQDNSRKLSKTLPNYAL